MTDEITRTRRRVRSRPSTEQPETAQRSRTRSRPQPSQQTGSPPGAGGTSSTQPAADIADATQSASGTGQPAARGDQSDAIMRRRRVRRRAGTAATEGRPSVAQEESQTDAAGADEPAERAPAEAAPAARPDDQETRKPRARNGSQARQQARDVAAAEGGPTAAADAPRPASDNRNGKSRKNRRKPGGAPRGGVSEETRRAVTEGPPRRMLVSVGSERTEVAVLEERDLVEHYVTRKSNESYVGNIYLGRVQNVLPGMEAAFVDIGKGRNGVLYAGEVNYDDDDVESKAPRIEQVLKPGQAVVVQVTKDPMGTKGARLTQQVSLAGRYCVLAIEDGTVGISRKLTDAERDSLREILAEIKPEGYGLIVRTAASGASREQLEADVKRLMNRWEQVQQRLENAKPLTEVYHEPELAMRVIRDVFGADYTELICDDAELCDQIREYLEDVSPGLVSTVTHYQDEQPLFDAYEITNQVRRALEKKVWLASGGYLIIEKTEAMWIIDVNTGKFVGDSNLEETVLRNNLEAAEEIARQLRLRDMGGIIVIDFVDMLLPVNRDEVLKRFRRELARDKTKSRVMEISKLGLVQMTRKNVSQGLTETFTKTCECCEGRGAQIVDKALQR